MPFFTSNGTNIFVDRAGSGTPVLLLHGLTLDHRQWSPQRDAFQAGFELFCMDLRGHGRSAATGSGNHLGGLAADAQRALVQTGMDRHRPGFVVGHSISADAALQAALEEPRAVRGVVVVTPAVWGQVWSNDWLEMMRGMHRDAREGRLAQALERFRADPIFEGVVARPELESAVLEMQAEFSGAYLLSREREQGIPTLERVTQCKVPILVVRTERDRSDFRTTATAIAERAPHAQVVDLAGVGHFPNLEDPDRFSQAVLDFMREHS